MSMTALLDLRARVKFMLRGRDPDEWLGAYNDDLGGVPWALLHGSEFELAKVVRYLAARTPYNLVRPRVLPEIYMKDRGGACLIDATTGRCKTCNIWWFPALEESEWKNVN